MSAQLGMSGELAGVGISEVEERLYLDLLRSGGGSVTEIAAYSGLVAGALRAALAELEAKGLVGRTAGRRVRYWPVSPDTAVEMLAVRSQAQIERARLAAGRLAAQFPTVPTAAPGDVVEVLVGGDAVVNRNKQLLTEARREILAFTAQPVTLPTPDFVAFKLSLLARGVSGRVVYSLDMLELPGVVDFIEALHPAGEKARVVPAVPMALTIVDRRVAMLPCTLQGGRASDDFLLVRGSALLDALVALFELVWDRAVPFSAAAAPIENENEALSLSADDRRLLALLAAGMKDAAVARQLGVGPRTVERRLQRIMDRLGTITRFQTASDAALRGWIGSGDDRSREPAPR